jgi:hypothetical protein
MRGLLVLNRESSGEKQQKKQEGEGRGKMTEQIPFKTLLIIEKQAGFERFSHRWLSTILTTLRFFSVSESCPEKDSDILGYDSK